MRERGISTSFRDLELLTLFTKRIDSFCTHKGTRDGAFTHMYNSNRNAFIVTVKYNEVRNRIIFQKIHSLSIHVVLRLRRSLVTIFYGYNALL